MFKNVNEHDSHENVCLFAHWNYQADEWTSGRSNARSDVFATLSKIELGSAERKEAGREEFVRRGTVAERMFITKLSIGGGSNGLLSKAADNFMCSRPANEVPSWYSYFTKAAPQKPTRRLEFLAGFKRVYLIKLQFANNGNNPVKLIFRRQDRIARVISISRALSKSFFSYPKITTCHITTTSLRHTVLFLFFFFFRPTSAFWK